MMKEKYIKPDSDIQKFAAVDVITTSGGGDVTLQQNKVKF